MSTIALRPRTGTELIDAAFQLFRQHYAQLVLASAIAYLPGIVLGLVLPGWLKIIPHLLAMVSSTVAYAATVVVVSDSYLGREANAARAITQVLSRFGSVLAASILQGLLLVIGLMLLIVPAFIFFAWTFAMPAVVMLEGVGGADSFTRSRHLARGNVRRILATLGLTFLLFLIASVALTIVLAILPGGGEGKGAQLLSQVLQILIYPLVAIVATLLYYDLRIRKEAFDIQMMASELGAV